MKSKFSFVVFTFAAVCAMDAADVSANGWAGPWGAGPGNAERDFDGDGEDDFGGGGPGVDSGVNSGPNGIPFGGGMPNGVPFNGGVVPGQDGQVLIPVTPPGGNRIFGPGTVPQQPGQGRVEHRGRGGAAPGGAPVIDGRVPLDQYDAVANGVRQDRTPVETGEEVFIDKHGFCRFVTNTSGEPLVSPWKSPSEWRSFRANGHDEANIIECCYAVPVNVCGTTHVTGLLRAGESVSYTGGESLEITYTCTATNNVDLNGMLAITAITGRCSPPDTGGPNGPGNDDRDGGGGGGPGGGGGTGGDCGGNDNDGAGGGTCGPD